MALFPPTGSVSHPCSCPDKPLKTRRVWLPGSTSADLPVHYRSPSVALMVRTGGPAEHAVNPSQDAAQSLSLHLGKMEAEVYLGFALIWVWHSDGLCTWGRRNGHTLGAHTVTYTDFFFLPRPLCANVRESAGINLFHYLSFTSLAADKSW